MAKVFYPAVLERADDGFNVFFPDFDGCTSGGDTATEAALNAAQALELYLQFKAGALPEPSPLDAALIAEAEPAFRLLIPYERAPERAAA